MNHTNCSYYSAPTSSYVCLIQLLELLNFNELQFSWDGYPYYHVCRDFFWGETIGVEQLRAKFTTSSGELSTVQKAQMIRWDVKRRM